jgi:hypothetical protein
MDTNREASTLRKDTSEVPVSESPLLELANDPCVVGEYSGEPIYCGKICQVKYMFQNEDGCTDWLQRLGDIRSSSTNLRAHEVLSAMSYTYATPNTVGEIPPFFKLSQEIRDMIYHELWLETPIIGTVQNLPNSTADSKMNLWAKSTNGNLFVFGVVYGSPTTESLRWKAVSYTPWDDQSSFCERFFKVEELTNLGKLPDWLLTCKAFLREGLLQLHHNGEWVFYTPSSLPSHYRTCTPLSPNIFALLSPSMARRVSTNILHISVLRGKRRSQHPWRIATSASTNSVRDDNDFEELLGRLSQGHLSELKLGLDIGRLEVDNMKGDLNPDLYVDPAYLVYNQKCYKPIPRG